MRISQFFLCEDVFSSHYLHLHTKSYLIPPVFLNSRMKNGAPITEVKIETGISDEVTHLESVSTIIIKIAPSKILAGMTCLLLLPKSILEI